MRRNPVLKKVDENWTSQVYNCCGFTFRTLNHAPNVKKKSVVRVSSNDFLASYNNEKVSDIICLSLDGSVLG